VKTIINSSKRIPWFKASAVFLICLLFQTFPSCQKADNSLLTQESKAGLPATTISTTTGILYYGHKTFSRTFGTPVTEILKIENPNFNCFNNFVLKIQNGSDKNTRVSSADIKIDDVLIAGPSDFSKNVSFITKPLSGLTPTSVLEVKLNSAPGSFIDLWIEGTITIISPTFDQIGPLYQNSTAPVLPLSSTNTPAITGTWNPATISTATVGTTEYTFTPAEGQCAATTKMNIEIIINTGTVTDCEGNSYKSVKIGNQWWMAENLKTTKYCNGDIIGTTNPATLDISGETSPKYQWAPDGDENNVEIYGRLYTGYVISDSRKVCPTGWHVPSDEEWKELEFFLGMPVGDLDIFGGPRGAPYVDDKLKSTSGWLYQGNDGNGTNESGFSALPAGIRGTYGPFWDFGLHGVWWTSTLYGGAVNTLFGRMMYANMEAGVSRSLGTMNIGCSVRCIKDN
jgi:uncharacterized protein (TIGR02145 family)